MQMFANALTRYLRDRGLWAWSHLDNFLMAHPDPVYLRTVTADFTRILTENGVRINPKDTILEPCQEMKFLGFFLDGLKQTIAHTPSRLRDLEKTLEVLETIQSQRTYQRIAGHWAFYFSLYRGHYHALKPMFYAATTGNPVDPKCRNVYI